MSSEREGDLEEGPLSGDQSRSPTLASPTNQAGVASSDRSPEADWPPFFRQLLLRKSPTSTIFKNHVCKKGLETFLSDNPDPIASILRGRTALGAGLSCTRNNKDGKIMEQSIHLLLKCAACMSELCMIVVLKTDGLTEDLLCGSHTPPKQRNFASMSIFEAVLSHATTADLPSFYGNMGGPAEFPCVKLGLCRCVLRPLYAAIYFSNAHVVSTLLRYGAEVRPEDTCHCEETRRMHLLLRVYLVLTDMYCPSTGATYKRGKRSSSVNFVRCHQLAALMMPCL
ncbi:hypothetical protein HPB48_023120 [Haemaphysalis longicornis]|uniref:Uncharacterized protein n=1 Tax=Haemaphysalis longicornis TaxID=44386 RepID=A0A9J6H471_HAELO|nr:hypothetical protein HPB48_023120 [Haemaphysalis longicornis]